MSDKKAFDLFEVAPLQLLLNGCVTDFIADALGVDFSK